MSFMDEYRAGRVGAGQLVDHIDHWHAHIDGTPGAAGLEEWLGMTWAQYLEWTIYAQLPDADTTSRLVHPRPKDPR